jgi:hypothetical protein
VTEDEHGKAMIAIVRDVLDAAGIDRDKQDMMIEYTSPKIIELGPPPGWGNYGTRRWAIGSAGVMFLISGNILQLVSYLLGVLS